MVTKVTFNEPIKHVLVGHLLTFQSLGSGISSLPSVVHPRVIELSVTQLPVKFA